MYQVISGTSIRSKVSRLKSAMMCCLALAASIGIGQEPSGYAPEVGEPHPDFILPRLEDRQAVSLAQFRGKKVLLIHFASW